MPSLFSGCRDGTPPLAVGPVNPGLFPGQADQTGSAGGCHENLGPADRSFRRTTRAASADSEVRPGPRPPTLTPHQVKAREAGPEALPTSSLPTMSGCRRRVTARVLRADAPVLCGLLAEWRALIANMTVPELRVPPGGAEIERLFTRW